MDENLTPMPKIPTLAPKTMSFPDAIRHIINGKKVARVSWGNKDYGLLKDGWLTIYTKDAFHTWSVSGGDIMADDWTIVGKES